LAPDHIRCSGGSTILNLCSYEERSYYTHPSASPIVLNHTLSSLSAQKSSLSIGRFIAHTLLDRDGSHHIPATVRFLTECFYELLWWCINTFIQRRYSTDAIRRMIRNGTRVLLIAAPDEAYSIRRGERLMQWREKRTGRLDVEILPSLDHNLHVSRGREQGLCHHD